MQKRLGLLAVCSLWAVLSTCSGKDSATAPAAVAVSVRVSLPSQVVYVGASIQATVSVTDQNGDVMSGQAVNWSTSSVSATVTNSGFVTAVSTGTVTITATVGTHQGSAALNITVVPVASVHVTPATNSLYVGQTQQLTVVLQDSAGNALTDRTVSWSTSDSTKVGVSASGLATAVAVGSATITATSGSKTGTVTIQVALVPIARIAVTPATVSVQPWQTVSLSAIAYDSAGTQLSGRSFTWLSSDTVRAPVNSQGVVTGNLLGMFTVTASGAGRSASATVKIATGASVTVGPNVDMNTPIDAGETSVSVNPKNPLNLVASANWVHFASIDGGRSWKSIQYTTVGAGVDPNVAFNAQGVLIRQGITLGNPAPFLWVDRSLDGGLTMPDGLRTEAYIPLGAGGPDQGIMTVDTVSSSPYVGTIYEIVSDYSAVPIYNRIGFGLILFASRDGGLTWSAPIDISDCPENRQEPSSYITTGPNGEVYAAWPSGCHGQNQYMFTRSLDGGRTWSANTSIRNMFSPSTFVLTDDVRGNTTIDVDRSNGPNRGTIYISGNDSYSADAWLVRSTDGGNSWSSPIFLSDGPRGPYKYYFQSHINVAPNGRVDAAWYDTRNWGGTDINSVNYDVYYAYSANGGVSFSPSVRVTTVSSTKHTNCPTQNPCGDRQIGEYMGLASDSTRAMPVWTDRRTPNPRPYFAVIWNTVMSSSQSTRSSTALGKPKSR